jgi:hypothetical protein
MVIEGILLLRRRSGCPNSVHLVLSILQLFIAVGDIPYTRLRAEIGGRGPDDIRSWLGVRGSNIDTAKQKSNQRNDWGGPLPLFHLQAKTLTQY